MYDYIILKFHSIYTAERLRWSRGSVLPLVPKFAGSNPAEAVRFFRAKKILSKPSFGGEVKPSVPCRTFTACKRSLNLRGSRNVGKNYQTHFSPTVPPFAARISRVVADVQAPGGDRGDVLRRGKAMANYPQERSQDAVCQSHTGHIPASQASKAEY